MCYPGGMVNSTLSFRLRTAREMGGLSALGLSRLAGLPSGGHVGLIEAAKRPNPSTKTLLAIAGTLGVSIDWLVTGEGPGPDPEHVKRTVAAKRAEVDPKEAA